MTDKQIIIDKCPECEYYNFSLGGICGQTTLSTNGKNCAKCSDIIDCFIKVLYKQLKQKEQECDELKKQLERKEENYQKLLSKSNKYIHNLVDENVQDISNLAKQIDQLKADNEKLKEELSVIQHNCNREGCKYYNDNTFKVFYECKAQKALQLSANSVTTKYCDLLKTLTEIKEIAKNMNKECFYDDFDCKDCDMKNGCTYFNKKQILQKISECEVKDER